MKKIKILLIALVLVLGGVFFSSAYAVDVERSLGAQIERPFTSAKYQYGVEGNTSGSMLYYTLVKIFDNADKESDNLLYSRPFYCLRGGVGFGASSTNPEEDVSEDAVTYIQAEGSEMHTNASEVIAKYNELYNVNLNREETINETEVNIYNAILWILDESYLPKDIKNAEDETIYSAAEYKKELLDKAGVPTVQQADITDDDLEVIQQLAIWYFANYDEQLAGIKPTVSQSTMFPAQFLTVNGNNNIEDIKANNLDRIYQYFIYGAIENANTYTIDETTGERTKTIERNEFDDSLTLTIDSVNVSAPGTEIGPASYYRIGPFKIKNDINSRTGEKQVDATSIVLYDVEDSTIDKDYKVESNTGMVEHTIYEIVNESGNPVTSLQKGIDYYIVFYKAFEKDSTVIPYITADEQYDVSKVTLEITSSYNLSIATFLYAEENSSDNQAVVEIQKEKISDGDKITTKYYDLALRKFITSINRNGREIEIADRTPNIDISKLDGLDERMEKITTATYTHPKNALSVETGDEVIYTIRIYNEGEIDGKALEITDYLPEGLELASYTDGDNSINDIYGWVAGEGNKITTDYLKDTTIKAYDSTKTTPEAGWQKAETGEDGLYYADVQVECKVVAQITSADQALRNIAEISNDDGQDRDSTPNNVDTNNYEPPVDNSEYQEDDDDYEDLVLKTKEFDLSLRKFITKVERINTETLAKEEISIASRVPSIEIEGLKAGADTAKYIHPKNILSLKRGDIITYTVRVYNEGELNGYAMEVKDYLPEGLELVEGENDIWTVNGNILTTTSLNDQLLLGYDKDTTSVADGVKWQKASDDETGLYYNDLVVVCRIKDEVTDGAILKNVAEISSDKSEPTGINDRDSVPGNVYEDNEHIPGTETDGYTPGEEDDDDFEKVTVEPNEVFDLALRKYIIAVDGVNLDGEISRVPDISIDPLNQGETTADYNHKKDPVEVEIGNIVTYRFSVYNEGDIDGYVDSIVDYLPAGLEFDAQANTNFIEYKEVYEPEELEGKEYAYKIEGNKITILPLNEDKLFELVAFDGTALDNESIDVKFKVIAQESNVDQVLTNVATMTYGAKGATIADRDSNITGEEFTIPTAEKLLEDLPGYKGKETNKDDLTDETYHYEGQQDDDDFEKIIIKGKSFDLALRKFITSIKRNGEELEFVDRTPVINTETLVNGTFNRNGHLEPTATYEHSKEPLLVKQGDIITYTLRIYNEGERDGYATEITDYIPEGLALILNYNTNFDNEWQLPSDYDYDNTMNLVGENGFYKTEEDVKNLKLEDFSDTTSLREVQLVTGEIALTTKVVDEELLKAFDKTLTEETAGEEWQKAETGEGGLYYKDIQVSCLVIADNTYKDTITNIAEISEDKDKYGNDVIDRDSEPDNKQDPYNQSQEDDDDYEPVVLRYFDLALRKFITGVEKNGKVKDVTSRIPVLSIDEETGNIKYTHPKEEDPVEVANNDIVIYTLRVYNEGTLAGYAEEITDDIPEGLIYLPEHDINKQYEWEMINKDGEVTDNLEDAKTIKTEYLSKKNESENRDNSINPYDASKEISTIEPFNPEYRDIKVAFRVIEPNTSDRIIVNSAQISKDSDDDEDSVPGKWNEGEDDQDKEYIYVKYFDLSLLKWVTQTIVTVDGKTTTTETGFKPNTGLTETTGIRDNKENEPVAKVELDRKKLNKTTVKFAYKIRVTNEGEIAGYATEITDFIPKGLEFKAEDNKKYGWVKEGEDKVITRALETVLLEPGESTELEIIFTWKNDKNNLGVKTNIAEITEDYNEHNSQDIDSTPENKKDPYEKEQEDDDDFALVVLSLKTGKGMSYTILIATVVTMLATGIYLIKKYVLTY